MPQAKRKDQQKSIHGHIVVIRVVKICLAASVLQSKSKLASKMPKDFLVPKTLQAMRMMEKFVVVKSSAVKSYPLGRSAHAMLKRRHDAFMPIHSPSNTIHNVHKP